MICKLMTGIAIAIARPLLAVLIGPFFLLGELAEWWRNSQSEGERRPGHGACDTLPSGQGRPWALRAAATTGGVNDQ